GVERDDRGPRGRGDVRIRLGGLHGKGQADRHPVQQVQRTTAKKFVSRPQATASTACAPVETMSTPVRVRTTRESGATSVLPTMRLSPTSALITPSTHTASCPSRSRK